MGDEWENSNKGCVLAQSSKVLTKMQKAILFNAVGNEVQVKYNDFKYKLFLLSLIAHRNPLSLVYMMKVILFTGSSIRLDSKCKCNMNIRKINNSNHLIFSLKRTRKGNEEMCI